MYKVFLKKFSQLSSLYSFFYLDITLHPSSSIYTLEAMKLSWKTCELRINPNDRPQRIQYAELSSLNIKCTTAEAERCRLDHKLNSLKFQIQCHVGLLPCHRKSGHNLRSR